MQQRLFSPLKPPGGYGMWWCASQATTVRATTAIGRITKASNSLLLMPQHHAPAGIGPPHKPSRKRREPPRLPCDRALPQRLYLSQALGCRPIASCARNASAGPRIVATSGCSVSGVKRAVLETGRVQRRSNVKCAISPSSNRMTITCDRDASRLMSANAPRDTPESNRPAAKWKRKLWLASAPKAPITRVTSLSPSGEREFVPFAIAQIISSNGSHCNSYE